MKSILTPRQLAEAIGVSESSVKRWVDGGHITATRTAGGHRRIAIQEAARYIRERSIAIVRPDMLGFHDLAAFTGGESTGGDPGESLFEYLKAGAGPEARGLILATYLEGSSVAQIVDGPLSHALEKIGELWVSSPSGIFWEHRATQIAIQAISRLRLLLTSRAGAPAAVGGAPAGDPYIIPSLAVATVLEGEGLPATDLGPETPIASLLLAADEVDARLVWLSVSVAADAERLRREVEEAARKLADRGAIIVVGGAEAKKLALSRSDSVYIGRSMVELEAFVEGMRLAPGPAPSRA